MAANNSSTTFRSSLNPNAPLFVPSSFQAVEDFSPQWWHLVKSSPDFRVYWMQEEEHQFMADDDISLPDELFDIESFTDIGEMQGHADKVSSLESLGVDMKALTASKQSPAMKGWKLGQKQEVEKFMSKPAQIVPVPLSKTSIRRIQQPR